MTEPELAQNVQEIVTALRELAENVDRLIAVVGKLADGQGGLSTELEALRNDVDRLADGSASK